MRPVETEITQSSRGPRSKRKSSGFTGDQRGCESSDSPFVSLFGGLPSAGKIHSSRVVSCWTCATSALASGDHVGSSTRLARGTAPRRRTAREEIVYKEAAASPGATNASLVPSGEKGVWLVVRRPVSTPETFPSW